MRKDVPNTDVQQEYESLDFERGFDQLVSDYEGRIINAAYLEHPTRRKLAAALGISQTKASRLIRKYVQCLPTIKA